MEKLSVPPGLIADHTLERQHGGLGIGLALVKRLVEMHEGEVSAGANPAGLSRESGFDHHLVKPVDHDHLLKLIQKR